ncbi:MAG: UDP-N-acetylmuramoyl-tripeptide--D-alanyl-D-alanine ligase [Halothiobacillaceae bacterium]|jgi:UDP-N-acetylmuramoyl-tripeptide--D-alanyl-D-alanine ligase|nr:UDP-N-acetylmuramoyl-tripeptide--D-alanyl-D-alanine ligase [Halothiobacillaceae bacterium]MDY0049872.1 UDP-N-acetylmuramoyl-tripeptide--D-alanyl-D-alanine ligase [Halothiobacillaceae bacterium]
MIRWTLAQVAAAVDGQLFPNASNAERAFAGVSTDTRKLVPGTLFIALRGPNHDGHAYLEMAREHGAAAALVERGSESLDLPQIVVADTRRALGQLAAAWRASLPLRVVAVTGSNGKTTTKEMLHAIFARQGPTQATLGNLNNDIGVPLTLLGLSPDTRYAIVEMGANHPGEIAELTALVRPDVALVTMAGRAHLEGFGGPDGVVRAKGEIYAGLGADGVAIINLDSPGAAWWREINAGRRCLGFSLEGHPEADLRGHWQAQGTGGELQLEGAMRLTVRLPLPGRHNAANALAALCVAQALDVAPQAARQALEAMTPVKGRLNPHRLPSGALLLDDTYNANPDSLAAGIAAQKALGGESWLVLGDMGELGEAGQALHREAGQQARALGVRRLYALGPLAARAAEGFGDGARAFAGLEELLRALRAELAPEVVLLVKGSRFMRMEQVVSALLTAPETDVNTAGEPEKSKSESGSAA